MKARTTYLPALIITTLLVLLAVTSVFAMPITPVSYDMLNGGNGTYTYWDDKYSGSGSTTTSYASLSGGLGDLTDGISASAYWWKTPAPFVGWARNQTITFNFGSNVNLNSLTLYLDGPNGGGAVNLASVDLFMDNSPLTSVAVDPATLALLPVTFSDLGFYGDTLTMTLNRKNNAGWVFLSEVTFDGTYPMLQELNGHRPRPGTGHTGSSWCRSFRPGCVQQAAHVPQLI